MLMRRWVAFSVGVAVTAVLGACGAAGNPATAAEWVDAGIAHFRDASSVVVTPDSAGEATCSEAQPSCTPYTLTQTSTLALPAAPCPSIPACVSEFFSPPAHSYAFGSDAAPGVIYVTGDTGCSLGVWCSWTMSIDRASQEILAVDIHIGDTDHVGWPTYWFSNYDVSGRVLDTPTPSPVPSPTPPLSTGTLTATFSGDLTFQTGQLSARCDQDGFESFQGSQPVTATTPTLRLFLFSSWGEATAEVTVQIFPAPQHGTYTGYVFSYQGRATATSLGSDRWHVRLTGVIPREGAHGTLTVDATISCG